MTMFIGDYSLRYFFSSVRTLSYWKYALLSPSAIARILAAAGALYLFIEMLDFFKVYTRDQYSAYAFIFIIAASVAYVLFTRRPVARITYKIPKRDFSYEIRIGDLLESPENIVISTSTTFDTDMATGLISPNSLQGQFALRFFQGNTTEIDRQISQELKDTPFTENPHAPGKTATYPIGTVAKVNSHGRTFYFVAMSEMNAQGNAYSSVRMIDDALDSLWDFIANRGDLSDIAMSVMGTGRGRVEISRKKMIERIAQSFADASREKVFANKLSVIIHPTDASRYNINLFEIKDYLTQSMHI